MLIPSLTVLLVAGLAVARITSLIVDDDITEPIRHRVFRLSPPTEALGEQNYTVHDRRGNPLPPAVVGGQWTPPREPGFVGRVISCTHCTGIWVAATIWAAVHVAPHYVWPVTAVAALAQVSEAAIKASR